MSEYTSKFCESYLCYRPYIPAAPKAEDPLPNDIVVVAFLLEIVEKNC